MLDVGEIATVLTHPVTLLTGMAFGSASIGASLDRLWLRFKENRHARRVHESTLARVRAKAAPARVDAAGVLGSADGIPVAHLDAETRESRLAGVPDAGLSRAAEVAPGPQTRLEPRDDWAPVPSASPVPRGARAYVSVGHVQMGAVQQMAEFLAYVRASELGLDIATGRYRVTRTGPGWVSAYQRWANVRAIVPVPELTFLRLLSGLARAAETSGVEKARDRIKDPATGAVLRNGQGTPMRENVYTIYEAQPSAQPPGKSRLRRAA